MTIDRHEVARKIIDYLHHQITLHWLVDWAEDAMMGADFDSQDFEVIRDVVSKVGLADVRAYGITWEDCEDFLSELGYQVHVVVSEVPAMASVRR